MEIAKTIAMRLRGNPPSVFVATPTDGGKFFCRNAASSIKFCLGIYFAGLVADLLNRGVIILQVGISTFIHKS